MEIGEFLAMGGYARYVWPAYALSALVLAWNAWAALRLRREQLTAARQRTTRSQP